MFSDISISIGPEEVQESRGVCGLSTAADKISGRVLRNYILKQWQLNPFWTRFAVELIAFPWHAHSSVLLFAMEYFAQNKNTAFCSLLSMPFCSACTPCTFKLYCMITFGISQWGQLLKKNVISSCSHKIPYLYNLINVMITWTSEPRHSLHARPKRTACCTQRPYHRDNTKPCCWMQHLKKCGGMSFQNLRGEILSLHLGKTADVIEFYPVTQANKIVQNYL